jgi:hypothetical protein
MAPSESTANISTESEVLISTTCGKSEQQEVSPLLTLGGLAARNLHNCPSRGV